jgi:hypothetical protein
MKAHPDINDTVQAEGIPGVLRRHDNAPRYDGVHQDVSGSLRETTSSNQHEIIKLKFFNELPKPSSKPWLIKGVIAMGETSSWIGPPGAGKSGLLTDIAVHKAAGIETWRRYRIKSRAGVVYFALERANLVERRLMAYGLRDGLHDLPIAVAGQIIDLMSKACVPAIVDAVKRAEDRFGCAVELGIFDTYSKGIAAGGGDENQAKDQNIAIANLRRVMDQTGIHAATIGHTGKDETRGERGSNAKLADVDVQVQISGDSIKTATITKANDQPEGELASFKLEPYDFGPDEDGDPFRTFIVSREIPTGTPTTATKGLSNRQQLAMAALTETLLNHGRPAPPTYGLAANTKVVGADEWKAELFRRDVLDQNGKNPHARFNDLRDGLKTKHLIGSRDRLIWAATSQLRNPPS